VIFVCAMTELTHHELAAVIGGADDSFGRCGPGNSWRFLGEVRTPECAAHDKAVRDARSSGSSYLGAQWQALPKLPAAIGSYVKAKLG
jgi:bacteriocin-like protein